MPVGEYRREQQVDGLVLTDNHGTYLMPYQQHFRRKRRQFKSLLNDFFHRMVFIVV